jgi:hypothetical protein
LRRSRAKTQRGVVVTFEEFKAGRQSWRCRWKFWTAQSREVLWDIWERQSRQT